MISALSEQMKNQRLDDDHHVVAPRVRRLTGAINVGVIYSGPINSGLMNPGPINNSASESSAVDSGVNDTVAFHSGAIDFGVINSGLIMPRAINSCAINSGISEDVEDDSQADDDPPRKRPCRTSSDEGDWQPSESSVWRQVSRRRVNSGSALSTSMFNISQSRPTSASSGYCSQSSLSSGEPRRCNSQPCVSEQKKALKRRRQPERPSLDLTKMTQQMVAEQNCGSNEYQEDWHSFHTLDTIACSPPGTHLN